MPISFHFRPELNLTICVHTGYRSDDEFLAAYKSMYENDLFNVFMNRLVDMRQAKGSKSRSSTTLQQLSRFVEKQFAETNAHPKIAIVAPEDISFGLSRMYDFYTDPVPWDLEIFRSIDSALAWLGLPEDFMYNFDNER